MWLFNLLFKTSERESDRSWKWRDVRAEYLKNHPYCEACGRTKNLEVHHKIPVHLDPSKELDLNNLICLCGDYCHFVFGHLMDYKSWNTNVESDARFYFNKIINRPYKGNNNEQNFHINSIDSINSE